ncbi:MAG: hypothetical protein H0T46_20220 [Deltaproteobacteria bacterium]|nr:hypothetical protein [Deltaproteobacteria bacterium]
MSLVLDAGAFLAIERGDRLVAAVIKIELAEGRKPLTHGGVIAQIWRGGARQARVASLLEGTDVVPLDEELGRRTGVLLGRTRRTDAIDAALILIASDGDTVVTSDASDLRALAAAAGVHVDILEV